MDLIPALSETQVSDRMASHHFFLYPDSLTTDSLPLCHGAIEQRNR